MGRSVGVGQTVRVSGLGFHFMNVGKFLWAILFLLVGLGLSLALGRFLYQEESKAIELGFRSDIDQLSAVFEREVLLNLEILFALLLRAVPFALAISIGGAEMQQTILNLLMLFIGGGFIGTFLLVFLFAYIVHRPHQISDRYLNTSTIIISGPLSWPATVLWGFQNYHAVHHLFPWVPFYYYRHLFKRIRPTMELMGAPIYRLNWRGLRQVSVS